MDFGIETFKIETVFFSLLAEITAVSINYWIYFSIVNDCSC